MPRIELTFAEDVTEDGDRTLAGLAVPFGVASRPTANGRRYRFHRPPANAAESVDLVREHDPDAVIGRLAGWVPRAEGLGARARLFSTTAGNDALIEAAERVRPGFSVSADADEAGLTRAADGVYDVGDWTALHLGLVRRPAFAEALIAASEGTGDQEDGDAGDGDQHEDQTEEGTDEGLDDDTDDDDDTDTDDETEGDTMPGAQNVQAAAQVPPEHRRSRRGPRTLIEAAEAIAGAAARHGVVPGETDPGRINAALSDVTPGDGSNGLGDAFLRPEWLGELWTPENTDRPFVNAVGTTPLRSMKWQGWKWGVKPAVDKYAGNKTAIPSNQVTILPAEGDAYRVAGGWDVDRIFLDLGSPDFIAAMFTAATVDYNMKSEGWLAADLVAGATDAGDADSLVEALDLAARTLSGNGAQMSFVAMATDLWAEFLVLPESDVPWWLRNQARIDLAGTSTDVAGIRIFVDDGLADGTLVAGDRRAVDFRETGPIRVQAVNIPNGGIDIALFGYQGTLIQDARGLVTVGRTPVAPLSSRTSSTAS